MGTYYIRNSDGTLYEIEDSCLERDLGIMVSNYFKWASQVERAANKANSTVTRMRKTFHSFDAELVKQLCQSLFRSNIEYAVSVWNPYLKGDIARLKRFQHQVTWLLPELLGLPYEARLILRRNGLIRHDVIRERGVLIQFDKVRLKKDVVN